MKEHGRNRTGGVLKEYRGIQNRRNIGYEEKYGKQNNRKENNRK